jgi:hypothetical protein
LRSIELALEKWKICGSQKKYELAIQIDPTWPSVSPIRMIIISPSRKATAQKCIENESTPIIIFGARTKKNRMIFYEMLFGR